MVLDIVTAFLPPAYPGSLGRTAPQDPSLNTKNVYLNGQAKGVGPESIPATDASFITSDIGGGKKKVRSCQESHPGLSEYETQN